MNNNHWSENLSQKDIAVRRKLFSPLFRITPFWLRPNHITFLRIVAGIFLFLLMDKLSIITIIIILILGGLSDIFDGALAYERNQVTTLG